MAAPSSFATGLISAALAPYAAICRVSRLSPARTYFSASTGLRPSSRSQTGPSTLTMAVTRSGWRAAIW